MDHLTLTYAREAGIDRRQFKQLSIGAFALAMGVWAEAWGDRFFEEVVRTLHVWPDFPLGVYVMSLPHVFSLMIVMAAIGYLPSPSGRVTRRYVKCFKI